MKFSNIFFCLIFLQNKPWHFMWIFYLVARDSHEMSKYEQRYPGNATVTKHSFPGTPQVGEMRNKLASGTVRCASDWWSEGHGFDPCSSLLWCLSGFSLFWYLPHTVRATSLSKMQNFPQPILAGHFQRKILNIIQKVATLNFRINKRNHFQIN